MNIERSLCTSWVHSYGKNIQKLEKLFLIAFLIFFPGTYSRLNYCSFGLLRICRLSHLHHLFILYILFSSSHGCPDNRVVWDGNVELNIVNVNPRKKNRYFLKWTLKELFVAGYKKNAVFKNAINQQKSKRQN